MNTLSLLNVESFWYHWDLTYQLAAAVSMCCFSVFYRCSRINPKRIRTTQECGIRSCDFANDFFFAMFYVDFFCGGCALLESLCTSQIYEYLVHCFLNFSFAVFIFGNCSWIVCVAQTLITAHYKSIIIVFPTFLRYFCRIFLKVFFCVLNSFVGLVPNHIKK